MSTVLREHAEQQYAEELAALKHVVTWTIRNGSDDQTQILGRTSL